METSRRTRADQWYESEWPVRSPRRGLLYRAGGRPAIIRIKFHEHPDGKPGQLSEALGRTQNLQSFDDARDSTRADRLRTAC